MLVSIEEVGFSDLNLIVALSPIVRGYTCVSVSRRHYILKNS